MNRMQKRRERSRARAHKYRLNHAVLNNLIEGIRTPLKNARLAPMIATATAEEKEEYERTLEAVVAKVERAITELQSEGMDEFIVDRISDFAIVVQEANYYAKYKVHWQGFELPTWEHADQLMENVWVDKFWKQVEEDLKHPLRRGVRFIKLN